MLPGTVPAAWNCQTLPSRRVTSQRLRATFQARRALWKAVGVVVCSITAETLSVPAEVRVKRTRAPSARISSAHWYVAWSPVRYMSSQPVCPTPKLRVPMSAWR